MNLRSLLNKPRRKHHADLREATDDGMTACALESKDLILGDGYCNFSSFVIRTGPLANVFHHSTEVVTPVHLIVR
jgi:hypothetical protein